MTTQTIRFSGDDDIDVAYNAQQLAEDLFNDGNAWMLETVKSELTYNSQAGRWNGVHSECVDAALASLLM